MWWSHRLVWSGLWRHLHEEESVSGLSRKVEFEAEFEVEVKFGVEFEVQWVDQPGPTRPPPASC